jgi:cysteinyl-tRNA synthetase
MVDEKPKKEATPSESGRRSTLESNPQKSDAWWVDVDYPDRIPPIVLNEYRTEQFIGYRSFLIGKGLNECDGQTLRYMVALEDEYRQTIEDCNEQLDTAINSHHQLQEQYKLLRDEKKALQIQLADFEDEKNLLEEITSLKEEKAALERQLAVEEKLMKQVLDLRQELAAAKAATAAAQAAVVQAVNLRSGETPGAS